MSTINLNKVGHCEDGSSDKVYIASIIPITDSNGNTEYKVVGKASRIYKDMKSYDKGTFSSMSTAQIERDNLFDSKVKKGYVDIETANYMGRLTTKTQWLLDNVEPDPNFNSDVFLEYIGAKPKDSTPSPTPTPAPTSSDDEDFEVICINASGMEDSFDFEVTYIAEYHTDSDMIYVWDRNGEKKECFMERFGICEVKV